MIARVVRDRTTIKVWIAAESVCSKDNSREELSGLILFWSPMELSLRTGAFLSSITQDLLSKIHAIL